ncbi:MAG: AAA family ATPase [Gemmatimonadota bacterium]|nr:AAA family ATPase [Gemmatimonadota bacterium]
MSEIIVTETISSGQRSLVLRGVRISTQEPVILKRSVGIETGLGRARDRREYEFGSRVASPHVVRSLGLATVDGAQHLVQEDFGGIPLTRALGGKPASMESFFTIATGLANALDAIHGAGLIHHDLHPGNVLLAPATQEPRIIDFGSATPMSDRSARSGGGRRAGAIPYVSPEQTGRLNRVIDQRSDLFSLGVMLYEVLTGSNPFATRDDLDTTYAILTTRPPSVSSLVPDIPGPVSRIVAKLLEKAPEDRYQSARGLLRDLEWCRHGLGSADALEQFEPGTWDTGPALRLPGGIEGRSEELAALDAELTTCAEAGTPAMVLLRGEAGIGKSRLVQEWLHRNPEPISFLAMGGHESVRGDIPLSGLAQALSGAAHRLLATDPVLLDEWRSRLTTSLGSIGGVITGLVPAFAPLLDHPAPPPQVPPAEAAQRFTEALSTLFETLRGEGTFLLVMEDLHWADQATFDLLHQILARPRIGRLLVLCTCRTESDNDGDRPVEELLASLRAAAVRTVTMTVAPLDEDGLTDLVRSALGSSSKRAHSLARYLMNVSGGNPFAARETLRNLDRTGALTYRSDTQRWEWKLPDHPTDSEHPDVAQVIAHLTEPLDPSMGAIIRSAALLGSQFDLDTLATATGESHSAVWRAMVVAMDEGLVESTEDSFDVPEGISNPTGQSGLAMAFRHHRIREAIEYTIPVGDLPLLRRDVGRRLRVAYPEGDAVYPWRDWVGHLNAGLDAVHDPDGRIDIALANLWASRRARSSNAAKAALEHAAQALALMDSIEDSSPPMEMRIEALLLAAESTYLLGDPDEAETFAEEILTFAQKGTSRINAQRLRVLIRMSQDRWSDAVDIGLGALEDAGVPLGPFDPDAVADVTARGLAFGRKLMSAGVDGAPVIEDDVIEAVLALLGDLVSPCYVARSEALPFLGTKVLELSVEHGLSRYSAIGYNLLGAFDAILSGDFSRAYEPCRLAVDTAERFGDPAAEGRAKLTFGGIALPWSRPLPHAAPVLDEGARACRQGGDLMYAGYCHLQASILAFSAGNPLARVQADIAERRALLEETKNPTRHICESLDALAGLLRGVHQSSSLLDIDGEEDRSFLDMMTQAAFLHGLHYHHICKMWGRYILRPGAVGDDLAAASEASMAGAIGQFSTAEHIFLEGMFAARKADPDEALEGLAASRVRVEPMVAWCSANFTAKVALLRGEEARIRGDFQSAAKHFDEAVNHAREHGPIQDEAIAWELAGRLFHGHGHQFVAEIYLRHAHAAYARWGARAKCESLLKEFPIISQGSSLPMWVSPTSLSHSSGQQAIDLAAIGRITQAMSEEIDEDRLLQKVLDTFLRGTGSDIGHILVGEADDLRLRGSARRDGATIAVNLVQPVPPTAQSLATSVVRLALRTHDIAIVDSAGLSDTFKDDEYLRARRSLSVLCVPLRRKERAIGAIYLENSTLADAYTDESVRMLELLAPHAAISIENARLYAGLQTEIEQRREAEHRLERHTEELEELVEERARALREAQGELLRQERLATLGRITATVSHELRNPLGAARSSAFVLRKRLEGSGNEERVLPVLDRLDVGVERCQHIVDEMLEFTRQVDPQFVPVLVDPWLSSILDDWFPAPGVHLERDFDLGDVVVPMDQHRLRRAMENVISNAIQALTEGTDGASDPTPNAVVSVSTRRVSPEEVEITVRDNGPGISEDDRPKLFEPLFSTRAFGVGLGLTITKKCVETHGGSIAIHSPREAGTQVTIRLPLSPPSNA